MLMLIVYIILLGVGIFYLVSPEKALDKFMFKPKPGSKLSQMGSDALKKRVRIVGVCIIVLSCVALTQNISDGIERAEYCENYPSLCK